MTGKQLIRLLNQPINLGWFSRLSSGRLHPSSRLLNLLYGDRDAAIRLLSRTASRHPGKSGAWLNNCVIDDLIRDRAR